MREDEKQALIAYIGQLDRGETLFMPMRVIQELSESVRRVALASLTAEPVYQERRYQFIGKKQLEYWADIDRSGYGYLPESERRLIYTTPPAPSVLEDEC